MLLTVSGCPMKDTLTREVTAAVSVVPGVTGVRVDLGVMSDEQRVALREQLKGGQTDREIPFAQPGSLTKVIAVASGKGGVGKSSVTVNLALALAAAGAASACWTPTSTGTRCPPCSASPTAVPPPSRT